MSSPGPLYPVCTDIDRESSNEVTAELHADTDSHHQVDQGDGIEGDVPPVHQAAKVDDDQDDNEEIYDGGDQIESHEDKSDDEDSGEGDGEGLESVVPHGEVLLVENVENRVGENVHVLAWVVSAIVDELHDTVSQLPGPGQSHVVVPAGLEDGVECHHVGGPHRSDALGLGQLH